MVNSTSVMYTPWSSKVIESSIKNFSKGFLPNLDIELSAQCNHNSCVYCDSLVGISNPNELSFDNLKSIVDEGKMLGVEWVYVCGLGEPTNDKRFFEFVDYLYKHEINISVFSNGIGYSKDNINKLRDNCVNLILKLDSFNEDIFDYLLGKQGVARHIYRTLDWLLEGGYAQKNKDNSTDLAFSIVPTKINLNEIPKIIEFCKDNNIFPSVGELECSGKARIVFCELSPSRDELINLKKRIDKILGYDYKKPICPSAITGLHIDNLGRYVIDKKTGLSCSWYLLKEPSYLEIGQIGDDMKLIIDRMIHYRRSKMGEIKNLIKTSDQHVFGGCGGDIGTLMQLSLKQVGESIIW